MMPRMIILLGLAFCLAAGVVRADEQATEALIERLAPLPPGIDRTREDFSGRSGAAFDSLAAAGAAAGGTAALEANSSLRYRSSSASSCSSRSL